MVNDILSAGRAICRLAYWRFWNNSQRPSLCVYARFLILYRTVLGT
jgi:hypothetical protein